MGYGENIEDKRNRQRPLVLKGVTILDEKKPGWAMEIELKGDALPYAFYCNVLKIIFGSEAEGIRFLNLKNTWNCLMYNGFDVIDHGILFHGCEEGSTADSFDREVFEEIWREQILIRRTSTPQT